MTKLLRLIGLNMRALLKDNQINASLIVSWPVHVGHNDCPYLVTQFRKHFVVTLWCILNLPCSLYHLMIIMFLSRKILHNILYTTIKDKPACFVHQLSLLYRVRSHAYQLDPPRTTKNVFFQKDKSEKWVQN